MWAITWTIYRKSYTRNREDVIASFAASAATFTAVHLNIVPLSVPDALNETVCGDGPMTKVPFSSVKMLTVGTGCPPVEMHVNVTFLPVDSGRIGPVIVTDSGGSVQKLNLFSNIFFKPH